MTLNSRDSINLKEVSRSCHRLRLAAMVWSWASLGAGNLLVIIESTVTAVCYYGIRVCQEDSNCSSGPRYDAIHVFLYALFIGILRIAYYRHCLTLSHESAPVEATKTRRPRLHHLGMPHVPKRCVLWLQISLEPDERALVAHLVAIVWRAEYRHGLPIVRNLVSILLAFMTAQKIKSLE